MSGEPVLAAEGIGKRFGGFTALEDVSVSFERGRLTAIIGPNGAGKSTFFSLLSGAVTPTTGTIRFEGNDLAGQPQFRFARMGIARSYQITNLFPQLSAHENVRLACQAIHAPARNGLWRNRDVYPALAEEADATLALVGLQSRRMRLAASLAHGEQRALEIAVALASRPKLLLLDEPTAGMSPEETKEMMDLIARLASERTVLLVEHKMKMVMGLADRIVVLHQGKLLASGSPDDIRADPAVRRVYLGEGRSGRVDALLRVRDLNAWYGPAHVLQGVDLSVAPGEIVAVVGRNGAGKTTMVRTVMGLIAKRSGSVVFDGHDLSNRPAHHRFGLGLGYVPEDRRIVPGLTVRENLKLGLLSARLGAAAEAQAIADVARRFPRLGERLAQEAITMSGGEQQMLAIARAMLSTPKMILLDEPSEGIMPSLVDEMAELFLELKRGGTSLLLIEQNVELALEISDRAYILDQGRLVHEGASADLLLDDAIRERYCAV